VGIDHLERLQAHVVEHLGETTGRASVTFVGTEPVEVLRIGPNAERITRYVTLGMSRYPMTDPTEPVADPVRGPRAELMLSMRGVHDEVLRPLAVLAMSPFVEGVVVAPGASLDVGGPLWHGGTSSAVLVSQPGGLVPDFSLDPPAEPVRFLPLLPMTPTEAAYKRVHGAEALQELWLRYGTDVRDPIRTAVPLEQPQPRARE
jgi:hypothetical protein